MVLAEMLVKKNASVSHSRPTTFLAGRDLVGTIVAALIVLVYVANVQDWWYLGSNRWAAVTMLVIGFAGCPLAARFEDAREHRVPLALLGLLGVVAFALAVIAIVSAEQWALLSLAIVVVALWAGTTFRHAVTPPPRLGV